MSVYTADFLGTPNRGCQCFNVTVPADCWAQNSASRFIKKKRNSVSVRSISAREIGMDGIKNLLPIHKPLCKRRRRTTKAAQNCSDLKFVATSHVVKDFMQQLQQNALHLIFALTKFQLPHSPPCFCVRAA